MEGSIYQGHEEYRFINRKNVFEVKKLISQLFNHSSEIFVGLLILAPALVLIQSLWKRIEGHFYNDLVYVYACPQNAQNRKCYKVTANMASESDGEFAVWYIEKINFDNGGYIYFTHCDLTDRIYYCYPEKEQDGTWKVQISEVVKIRK